MTQPELPVPEEAVPDVSTGWSQIRWDDPGVGAAYANAFTISATRDEIVFLFGMKRDRKAGAEEPTVRVSHRVVLAPSVARRLLEKLADSIRAYERTFGPLDATPLPSASVECRPPSMRFPGTDARTAGEHATVLFRLVESLNVGAGYERSVKLAERSLLGNRFLLGVSKRTLGHGADARILDICEKLQMPRDSLDLFAGRLADANYVHFGYEENDRACLYKVYLEFWRKIEENLKPHQPDAGGPFLLHLGFKWGAFGTAESATTRYTWHPWLPVEDILSRVTRLLDPQDHGHTLGIVKGIIGLASERISHKDILFLEVTEDGNQRRSFDINTYRANLALAELYPLWLQIGRQYSIPFRQMQAFYESVRHKVFGHISGGIDREGRDFLTVYYGAEGLHGAQPPSGLSVDGSPAAARVYEPVSSPGKPRPDGVERADDTASRMYRLVQDLNIQVGFERSFKFLQAAVLTDRFLMGFKKGEIRRGLDEEILNICRQIEMPAHFLDSFSAQLPEATIVLFGFEKSEKSRVCKAYLEFGGRLEGASGERRERPKPVLAHLGFKWDASDNTRNRMTRYTCVPGLPVDDMLRRIWDAFYRQKDRRLILLLEGILGLAATRAGPNAFLYLEAAEEGNPQASFDVNIYRANLRMEELYPFLLEAGRVYSIPSGRFHGLYEPVKTQIFGHVRGGSDRDGRDFLAIYFGEKGSSR